MQIKIRTTRTGVRFSETQVQEIEELASRMTIDKVAEQFGMEEEIFTEALRCQKPALRAYKKGRVVGALRAAEPLRERMEAGDVAATIFFSKLYGVWDDEQKREVADKDHPLPAFKIVMDRKL